MLVEYKQGMTRVWCDGEKIIIFNPTGNRHCEHNVDQIFGVGEWARILDVHYEENKPVTGRDYSIVSGYIPQRAIDDLELDENKSREAGIPGISDEDLIKKYFKGT